MTTERPPGAEAVTKAAAGGGWALAEACRWAPSTEARAQQGSEEPPPVPSGLVFSGWNCLPRSN